MVETGGREMLRCISIALIALRSVPRMFPPRYASSIHRINYLIFSLATSNKICLFFRFRLLLPDLPGRDVGAQPHLLLLHGRQQAVLVRVQSHYEGQTGKMHACSIVYDTLPSPDWRINLVFQVQIRPWSLGDSDFVMDGSQALDPRKTIFVGGVPRPLKAGTQSIIISHLNEIHDT